MPRKSKRTQDKDRDRLRREQEANRGVVRPERFVWTLDDLPDIHQYDDAGDLIEPESDEAGVVND